MVYKFRLFQQKGDIEDRIGKLWSLDEYSLYLLHV